MEPLAPQAAAGGFGVCSLLQAGCVGRDKVASEEAMPEEKGKRGSWWIAKELGLTCFLLLRCLDLG